MAPSLGFTAPVVGLFLGLLVLVVSLFLLGGLNPLAYAGILLGLASIIGLLLAVMATPAPGHNSVG